MKTKNLHVRTIHPSAHLLVERQPINSLIYMCAPFIHLPTYLLNDSQSTVCSAGLKSAGTSPTASSIRSAGPNPVVRCAAGWGGLHLTPPTPTPHWCPSPILNPSLAAASHPHPSASSSALLPPRRLALSPVAVVAPMSAYGG
jgi:hypothetical protein